MGRNLRYWEVWAGDLVFSDRSAVFVGKRVGRGMVLLAARTGAHGIA